VELHKLRTGRERDAQPVRRASTAAKSAALTHYLVRFPVGERADPLRLVSEHAGIKSGIPFR